MPVGYLDYFIKPKDLFLLDLLSKNEKYLSGNLLGKFYLNQAFATAGKLFRVFDQETWDVVVPYGEGAVLIRELLSQKSPTVAYLHQWVCRAKAYTIGIYDYQKKKLLRKAKTEEQKKKVIENVKLAKMAMRKELIEEKNRNYHIDNNRPTEIKKYLLWNKQVHKTGLIKDGVVQNAAKRFATGAQLLFVS